MAKRGAPYNNDNASRGGRFRSMLNAAVARRDDKLGKPDGYTMSQLFDGYVEEALVEKETRKDLLDRAFGKPAQTLDVSADITNRSAEELSDAELLAIATGGGEGDSDAPPSTPEPAGVH